jgi:DNA-binding NarL/FixJ family response regulator
LNLIRILVVDDHEILRRNICNLLMTEMDLDVVSQASTGREAVARAEQHQPHVVVMDISMPELNGLAAAPLIKKVAPSAEILIVTGHATPSVLREAFGAGARGFLSKNDIATDLIQAVRAVHSQQQFLSTAVKNLNFSQST